MTVTQNLYLAIAVPFLLAPLLLKGDAKRFTIFSFTGLTVCMLSSYINTFFAATAGMDAVEASIKWTPIVEEALKALPVLFYVVVFAPKPEELRNAAFAIGMGFVTLENTSYLLQFGNLNLEYALVRGLSAGLMHTVCAVLLGYGLSFAYEREWLKTFAFFALLSATSTFHAVYNLLVQASGVWLAAGLALPIVTLAVIIAARLMVSKSKL
jgi:RsiW-degrading membrane proteinase PrsW (M82 family)